MNKTILFERERLDNNLFKIEDVLGDNACFYRSIANGIRFQHVQDLTKEYSYDTREQTQLSLELQSIILNWVKDHPHHSLHYDTDIIISVEDMVELIHDISYHQYLNLYSHFAGSSSLLPNRWGSFFEQSILSEIFKLPIIVLSLEKYDSRKNKIVSGRIWLGKKAYQNTRFKILQISGKQYLDKPHTSPIYILWRKNKKGCEHYMSLYPIELTDRHVKHLLES